MAGTNPTIVTITLAADRTDTASTLFAITQDDTFDLLFAPTAVTHLMDIAGLEIMDAITAINKAAEDGTFTLCLV